MNIRTCKSCGFILGTRPNSSEKDGECLACYNKSKKENINWEERQKWLTNYIQEKKKDTLEYDCAVGVSGGKDSYSIVKRLFENHKVNKILLIHIEDEFTTSKSGKENLDNLVKRYNVDIVNFRFSPSLFKEKARYYFFEELNPLKWFEHQVYDKTLNIAKKFNIPIVFMGENPAFEYGESEECDIFHPDSDDYIRIIYFYSIWPYSNIDALEQARMIGFKTLADNDDWQRQGTIEDFAQIDSYGYMVHLWLKFVKFGFQRVSDMACRFVRENKLSKEQAELLIKDNDWICDYRAKKDFCSVLKISEKEFDDTVDKFANKDLLVKDVNNNWRRIDLI